MDDYMSVGIIELCLYIKVWMNFTNMMLSQRSQTPKSVYYKIPFTLCFKTDRMDLLCLKTKQWLPLVGEMTGRGQEGGF